jgi:hypothetical protein
MTLGVTTKHENSQGLALRAFNNLPLFSKEQL